MIMLLVVFIVVIALFILKIWKFFNYIPPVPKLEQQSWGSNDGDVIDNKTIKPFRIGVSDEVITDLKYRLKTARSLSPPLQGTKHEYGINSQLTKKITDYWINKYDWREREKYLNQFPQYKTMIQGLNIHFLHVKPKETKNLKVFPLLILHGWPGSVREFYEIIPLLTTPQDGRNFVFEVIAPSLPGYGFSDSAVRPGMGPPQIALIMRNLMLRLNLERFYIQGGDWGSMIMTNMAILFPENVIAIHNNLCVDFSTRTLLKRCFYSFWPSLVVEKKYQRYFLPTKKFFSFLIAQSGYYHIQATKPDTVGVALCDSPVGLAAYILEKFLGRSGELTDKFSMESLLDNVMIYWVTSSMTTAMRLYAESYNKTVSSLKLNSIPVQVPTGCSRFLEDLAYFPTVLLKNKYPNLIHVTDNEGGHFAALQCPRILAEDLYTFIEKVQCKITE